MSAIPPEQPGQIGPGNDMDMIKSYGGTAENQQTSTTQGGSLAVNTVPTDNVNKNPETEPKPNPSQT